MHQTVSMVEDMMFFNEVGFLMIISINIKFTTVQYVGKHMTVNLSKSLENINEVYSKRGMYVETYYVDREFEKLLGVISGSENLNKTASV